MKNNDSSLLKNALEILFQRVMIDRWLGNSFWWKSEKCFWFSLIRKWSYQGAEAATRYGPGSYGFNSGLNVQHGQIYKRFKTCKISLLFSIAFTTISPIKNQKKISSTLNFCSLKNVCVLCSRLGAGAAGALIKILRRCSSRIKVMRLLNTDHYFLALWF
jgi:hypothetical protein